METEIYISKHGHERLKERGRIKSIKERQRRAELAFSRGKPICTEHRIHQNRHSIHLIMEYQNYRWVFSQNGVLITVYLVEKKEKDE